ncbi:unnamed protein product [Pseudo-nitzschia multistriata]|uniref:Uncharacterized protein n=1 Tax=Pseudo-nitzschia multistriata TaxID=183589 RepID=A0A448ZTT8_9STRA|nr:unnamed protein product [Pseudo-nitzschia multistriata]
MADPEAPRLVRQDPPPPAEKDARGSKRPRPEPGPSTAAPPGESVRPVVTPTAEGSSPDAGPSSPPSKEAPKQGSSAETEEEIPDLARTLGLEAGDEIEVQWEIHRDEGQDQDHGEDQGRDGGGPEVSVHWWRATLMEYDGKTTDSVAVRTLCYEARPDLGFPEPSKEDVVFLGRDVLAASTDANSGDWEANPGAVRRMPYRRVGSGKASAKPEEEVFYYNDDQLDDQLNDLLLGALERNKEAWRAVPAARQAAIAEAIKEKKDKLKAILQAEAKKRDNKVITSETIREILARTF